MARKVERLILEIAPGYRSPEAASFIAQMEDLTKNLKHDLRGLSVRQLEWQPAPGMNSIGMLLAHLAVVEIWWLLGPGTGNTVVDFMGTIGIGMEDDGIPLKPKGGHPEILRGKPLAWYLRTMARARRAVTKVAKTLDGRAVTRVRKRIHPRRKVRQVYNTQWVMYHVVEHYAGHYYQILLLLHAMKSMPRAKRA